MKLEKFIGIFIAIILLSTTVLYFTLPKTKEVKVLGIAKEISTPNGFINTNGEEITIGQYKGKKVVLLDIWTYSCINCKRTIPYLNSWYEKYSDQGLEIIGLHTPEFSFEKDINNVRKAVEDLGIKYPVVLDNDYSTWRDYGNKYWPRKYLIDLEGNIIYDHIGEGAYDETEKAIQKALGISQEVLDIEQAVEFEKVGSPEIYFGASRNSRLGNGISGLIGKQEFNIVGNVLPNQLYLDGKWEIKEEYAENLTEAEIKFNFSAKNVYMVLSSDKSINLDVYIDGKFYKNLLVQEETLYDIYNGENYGEHLLEIKIQKSGLKAFTFTFG